MTTKRRLLLVDAYGLIYRAFHALPPLTNSRGQLTNAAYGFTSILLRTMADGRTPRRWTASRRDMWAKLGFGALAGGIAATGWLPFAAGAWRFAANFSPSPAFAPAGVPLLVIGALTFGLAAGMAYAALRRALPANQWLCGVVFGVACAALIALFVGATSTELRAVSLAIPGLIGITIVAAGLAASLIFGQLERVKA